MDISKGFQLDEPNVFIPWRIDEKQLRALFPHGLRRVTNGYYTIACESLGGLIHRLGFHFSSHDEGYLVELEFFRSQYSDWDESYQDFQKHFERAFGKPTTVKPGREQWPDCEWNLSGATIGHCIFDRFGLEERLSIRVDSK